MPKGIIVSTGMMKSSRSLRFTAVYMEKRSKIRADLYMDVFISHSEPDKVVAERLAADLERRGINVWPDVWSAKSDETIQTALTRALSDVHTIILLISEQARTGEWQEFEWRKALELTWADPQKQLLGVLVGQSGAPPFLAEWKVIKADPNSSDWDTIVDELATIVLQPQTQLSPRQDWRAFTQGRVNEFQAWVHDLSPNPESLGQEKQRLQQLISETFAEDESTGERLLQLASVERELGDLEAARASLLRAVEISEKLPASEKKGILLVALAAVERKLGSVESAINRLQQALAIYKSLSKSNDILSTLSLLASFYRDSGRPDTGRQCLEQAIQLASSIGPAAYPSAETLKLLSQEYQHNKADRSEG